MSQQARPTPNDFLFLGTHGHVVAVNKRNGRKAWQMSLPKTGWDVVAIDVPEGRTLTQVQGETSTHTANSQGCSRSGCQRSQACVQRVEGTLVRGPFQVAQWT